MFLCLDIHRRNEPLEWAWKRKTSGM